MSVIGIDFGSFASVIATIQRGAVSIVRNDLSERLTPSLISYTNNERHIGEAAQTIMKSNYKSTCRYMKQLMGLTELDKQTVEIEKQYALAPLDFADPHEAGLAGYRVTYKNEEVIFTATQTTTSLLAFLKNMAEKSTQCPVQNVVISVPGWYTDRARRAVLDAAEMANLTCLKTINEHAAVALDYGIYRSNTFDAKKSSRVVFISVGHGSSFVSIVDFIRGELKIVGCKWDRYLGGRDIDLLLVEYFAKTFEKQHGVYPLTNNKIKLKLEDVATKIKKVLSANSEACFNVEYLANNEDLNGILTRTEFESICEPIREKLLNLLNSVFIESGIKKEEIDHIELVGGCCRTPWIQNTISDFFDQRVPLSRTLDMDETVARGCALQAAMLDPRYKVREFNIIDHSLDTIGVSYTSHSNGVPEIKTGVLFEKGSVLGSRKWLTFARSHDFEIQLSGENQGLLENVQIQLPHENADSPFQKRIKLCVRLSPHGTVVCESAQLLLDEEVTEENVPLSSTNENAPGGSEQQGKNTVSEQDPNNNQAFAPNKDTTVNTNVPSTVNKEQNANKDSSANKEADSSSKKKIKTRRLPCQVKFTALQGYLDPVLKQKLIELENRMAMDDAKQRKAKELMNDLETYIYEMKTSMNGDDLKPYATPEESNLVMQALNQATEWLDRLPDLEQEPTADDFQIQLTQLQNICTPVLNKKQDRFKIQQAINDYLDTTLVLREMTSNENLQNRWAHVAEEKILSLLAKIDTAEKTIQQLNLTVQQTPLFKPLSINYANLINEKDMLINFSKTVFEPLQTQNKQSPTTQQENQDRSKPKEDTQKNDENYQFNPEFMNDHETPNSQNQQTFNQANSQNVDTPMN